MSNPASYQNQLTQLETQEIKDNVHKRLSRRTWLRNAIVTVTSAVVLLSFFTGCTKEQWDDIVDKIPGGVGSTPGDWYVLRVTYQDENGKPQVGYLTSIGSNASTSFWDYMAIRKNDGNVGGLRFKVHSGENGFDYWEMEDTYWLSLKYDGWAYRSYESNRVGWKIVDGKLYTDYGRWKDYPLGSQRRKVLVPDAYYVGADLGADKVLTNCELVPAP